MRRLLQRYRPCRAPSSAFGFKIFLASLLVLLACPAATAQLSFYTAIDQALRNSPRIRMGVADVQRAQAGVAESVDAYKPSFLLGSSVGWTYGFPLGQPEIFSLTAQSLAFSFSQPDYLRAARKSLRAAQMQLKDTQQQVIFDTALDYIELAKIQQQIAALDQEDGYAQRLVEIESQRVDAGRDSRVELTQARLTGAQAALSRLHLMDRADLLRAQLAHLTGLTPADVTADPKSIPAPPTPASNVDFTAASRDSSGVQAAYAAASSKLYTAFGDRRQNNRPIITFVANYGLFSNLLNNYGQYYLHFQQSNFGAGLQINVPLFDSSRKARAQGSMADATHAAAEADQLRDQVSEQTLELQKSLAELSAQEKVALLQSELAQDQLDAVKTQLQSGSANPNAAPLTPKDEELAQINERVRYIDMLDARFQLTRAQLGLLRSLGQIQDWAKSNLQVKP